MKDLKYYAITSRDLRVIGYGNIAGVDTSRFSPKLQDIILVASDLRTRLKINENEFVFVFVGRLNRDKGLKELMQAFESMPHSAHLLLVGGLDASAPVALSVLDALRAHPRVHELGFLHDIRPALALSDVLVLPSYREGFPNVVLQAGSMELPVIATDINGCNEVIDHGFNGWLVAPRDTPSLQSAMWEALRSDPDTLHRMGERGRARVKARFEQQHHWQRMVVFYKSLLTDGGFMDG